MAKSIILIIVGVILLGIAFLTAGTIPGEMHRDLISNGELLQKNQGINLFTLENEISFMETHAHRRLLQNFYLGASGLICLAVGLGALPKENKQDTNVKSLSPSDN
jgi:hypothetical protein